MSHLIGFDISTTYIGITVLNANRDFGSDGLNIAKLEHIDFKDCKTFWEKATASKVSFVKTQIIIGRHPTKRLQTGICMVSTRNKYLKIKILEWIDLFHKKNIMV